MARDQIEVDLLLNSKKAEATIKRMNRELEKTGKAMSRGFGGGGAADKTRALGTGLSKATVRADEFNKSLEASNARVIAFGASAGLIMNIDRALKAMVRSAIQVEKAMADVNVVMNASDRSLKKFEKGMFSVAKNTAQSFETVAEAAVELARQGLGMEKTLARTNDALILTRLTGMNAADSVKALTAAVNSFNKEGVTSAQIVNRMAKVDAAFAVSSEDLAKAISRVGSSAVDAGVNMNELMAITTAVQQKTARGGAVIGNAFKTIFTRIQRSDVQAKLRGFGVATTDMSGKMLSGIQVIENLSKKFGDLTKAQQASVGESVAGVFQINILKAAMSDLSSATAQYKRALDVANSATDDAYKRNEQLNQTLDALVNRTLANLTQAGAALGGGLFGPAIENVLGLVNSTIESFGKDGAMEGFGKTIGGSLMKGIGKFIAGPGLVFATAIFGKLAFSLGKFAMTALKDIVGLNNATKQRAGLEEMVVKALAKEPALYNQALSGANGVLTVQRRILDTIKQQQTARATMSLHGGNIATALYGQGARVGRSGNAFIRRGPGRADGHIPSFAQGLVPGIERASARAGGYTAGAVKTMHQPGAGRIMYNSAETVRKFPGMAQKAIMPPKGSRAGASYGAAFGAAHGFDPYAARGIVPRGRRFVSGGGNVMPGSTAKTGTAKAAEKAALDTASNTKSLASSFKEIANKHQTSLSMGGFLAYSAMQTGAAATGGKAGAGIGIGANVAMMAGTGAAIGSAVPGLGTAMGAIVGAGIGLASSFNEIGVLLSDGSDEIREALQKTVTVVDENLNQIAGSLDKLANYDTMSAKDRILEISKLEKKRLDTIRELEKTSKATGDTTFMGMAAKMMTTLPSAGMLLSKGVPSADDLREQQKALQKFGVEQNQAAIFAASTKKGRAFSDMTYKTSAIGTVPGQIPSVAEIERLGVYQPSVKNTKKSQELMRNILGPEVIAEMLSKEGGITGLREASGMKGAAGLMKFTSLLEKSGFSGLAKGFDTQFSTGSKGVQQGMLASFRNMFTQGGVFSPQMMDAFAGVGPMQGPANKPGMSLDESQRGTFFAGQRALLRGRQSSSDLTRGMARITRQGAANALDNRLAVAGKQATEFGMGLIAAKKQLEEERIVKEKNLAIDKAELQQKQAIASSAAGAETTFMTNLLKEKNIGTPEREEVKKTLAAIQADPLTARIMQTSLRTRETLSPQEKLLLTYLNTTIGAEADARSKGADAINEANASYGANKAAVDKNTRSQIELFNASQRFQFKKRIGQLDVDANKAGAEVGGLLAMQQGTAPGFRGRRFGITNQDIAGAAGAARMANFKAGRGTLDPYQSFRESFAYGGNDALVEFDAGMKSVASDMKSSFADAFQAISSGSNSVKGALANMAQSILSSISSMSSQIFTNMLFSSFGNNALPTAAHGGYIPGYAGGGLVTGGSGFKDDVMTKMQGGEFVIKKSAVNQIGLPALNAINSAPGYANGGQAPSMWKMGAVAAGAGALSGVIAGASAPGQPDPAPSRDYGMGRSDLGYLGGADPDSGRVDSISGGGGRGSVSLAKGYVYYRRDPSTGRLVSERARPTEGRFEVSDRLSLLGRLSGEDPQTSRMFSKEQTMARYQDYLATETQSRKDQVNAVKKQKRQRLIGAYMNAAMLIGGAKFFGGNEAANAVAQGAGGAVSDAVQVRSQMAATGSPYAGTNQNFVDYSGTVPSQGTVTSHWTNLHGSGSTPPGNANGGLAKVMGGEYIMSPQAVRTHGVGFMTELNRGNVPGYASGGLVGGGGGGGGSVMNTGGNMTNNVKINVNIDKAGKADVQSSASSDTSGPSEERGDQQEAQDNAKFSELLSNIVIEEIVKQQRPGGLLQQQPTSL
jgi:TP901 family phage tail tape measure protein